VSKKIIHCALVCLTLVGTISLSAVRTFAQTSNAKVVEVNAFNNLVAKTVVLEKFNSYQVESEKVYNDIDTAISDLDGELSSEKTEYSEAIIDLLYRVELGVNDIVLVYQ